MWILFGIYTCLYLLSFCCRIVKNFVLNAVSNDISAVTYVTWTYLGANLELGFFGKLKFFG